MFCPSVCKACRDSPVLCSGCLRQRSRLSARRPQGQRHAEETPPVGASGETKNNDGARCRPLWLRLVVLPSPRNLDDNAFSDGNTEASKESEQKSANMRGGGRPTAWGSEEESHTDECRRRQAVTAGHALPSHLTTCDISIMFT